MLAFSACSDDPDGTIDSDVAADTFVADDTAVEPDTTVVDTTSVDTHPVGPLPASLRDWGTSGGAGGLTGEKVVGDFAFGALSAGYSYYAPAGLDAPAPVALFFHGDGGSVEGLDYTWKPEWQAFAEEHGMIIMSLGAPTASGCWWTPTKHTVARYVVDLVSSELFPLFDVDLGRVHMVGFSGGAFWLFGAPLYEELPFFGGLAGVCGGDVPRENSQFDFCNEDDLSADDPPLDVSDTERRLQALGRKVYVARNSDDFWVSAIDGGIDWWEAGGAETKLVDEGPGGHCEFDTDARLEEALEWFEAAPASGSGGY